MGNTIASLETRICNLISKNAIVTSTEKISPDVSLYSEYAVDSIKLVELIVIIEEDFNVKFEDTELDMKNLETVRGIAQIIHKKLSPQP